MLRIRYDRLKRDEGDPSRAFWTVAMEDYLRTQWPFGRSTAKLAAEITAKFGTEGRVWSKNAIVGKTHRLDLPPRPNPIRRGDPRSIAPTLVVPIDHTLVVLTDLTVVVDHAVDPGDIWLPEASPMPAPVLLNKPALSEPPAWSLAARKVVPIFKMACQYPFGTPRTKTFRFCGKPPWSCEDPTESTIYCKTHHLKCHEPRRAA